MSREVASPPGSEVEALVGLCNQGKLVQAVDQANTLAAQYPHSIAIWNILGAASMGLKRFDQAADAFIKALNINPDFAEVHSNLGAVFREQGKLDEAVACYRRALALKPNYADVHNNLGNVLKEQGKLDDAVASYGRALTLRPDYAQAHNNLGYALMDQGRLDEAEASLGRALALKPDYADAHNNLGNVLEEQGKLDDAVASFGRALVHQPDHAQAHINLGHVLTGLGRLDEAELSCRRALRLSSDSAEAHMNLGNVLTGLGRFDEAELSYRWALLLNPAFAEAHINLGNTLKKKGKLDEAVISYGQAIALKPDHDRTIAEKFFAQAEMGDWTTFDESKNIACRLGIAGREVPPFAMLTFDDDPARNNMRSEHHAREKFGRIAALSVPRPVAMPAKLRIGYFSADFHDHATMYLMAGLFREHDRQRFEIHAYSYGPGHDGEMRERLVRDVDSFSDVRDMPDPEIVALAHRRGLDIAIDLKGYTQHGRSGLFASRLAPIQINYLGYPGTMGASFIDYIIADDMVIPVEQQAYYSEKIIRLPNSYQVNDDRRLISDRVTTRAEHGLPETGTVFCCFNNSYKITPAEFDIWMRLLQGVEGSVLWLFKANTWIEANLRDAAQARGVDPDRLIFADHMPQAEHLARQRHADLFLDTFNVNAHTTASDALWAGLPVVTRPGKGFAAKVGASLLNAIGLPELITESEADYEQLALALATNPDRLSAIRARLAKNRLTAPLFNTALITRHIEAAYEAAYGRYFNGQDPDHIRIT